MASRDAKLNAMDAAAREQRDMILSNKWLTPMQMAAKQRRDGALDKIRSMPPQDAQVGDAGIARAREALARGRQRVRSERS